MCIIRIGFVGQIMCQETDSGIVLTKTLFPCFSTKTCTRGKVLVWEDSLIRHSTV